MHAPHVRTKRPFRPRTNRRWNGFAKLQHAAPVHAVETRILRRGPTFSERTPRGDLAFQIAAGGVIFAAAVLGIAMGLAQPSWLLAAALVAAGALVTAVVTLSSARPVITN